MARFEPRLPNSEFKVLIARQPRPRNNVTFVIHLSQSFGLIPFTHVERVAYNIFSHEYVIRCGVVKMVAVHWCGQLYIHMHCRQCPASCLGAHNRKNGGNTYNAREIPDIYCCEKILSSLQFTRWAQLLEGRLELTWSRYLKGRSALIQD